MKRVNPPLKVVRSRTGVTMTERDLQSVMSGGSFELIEGQDYVGSLSTVEQQLRAMWKAKHGSIKFLQNGNSINVTVTEPTA